MKYITKLKLAAIHITCDAADKSTEYMLQAMQDCANVNIETVTDYLMLDDSEKEQLRKDVLAFAKTFQKMEDIGLS